MDFWCVSLGRELPVYWHSSDVDTIWWASSIQVREGWEGRKAPTELLPCKYNLIYARTNRLVPDWW